MKIQTNDRQGYQVTQRTRTDQGYLKVPGRVARIGVQEYLASELSLTDREPDEIVRVYRPPDEVFSEASLASYENADVTDDHPDALIDSTTYRQHAKGHTLGPGRAEGDYVVVDLLIKDQDAIDAVEGGKAELSAGYENEYHHEPGIAPDGTEYEFVQRNIRINHVALVDRGRAGNEAKLFDHKTTDGDNPMSTITLDGKTVKVGDDATAQLIQHSLDSQSEKMKDMEAKVKEAEDNLENLKKEKDEMKAAKDSQEEELEKAKEASSDAAISERLKAVAEVRDQAAKIAGDAFSCDSIDPLTIKREAMKAVRPSIDWAAQSEHYVAAAWDMESTKPEHESTRDRARMSHDRLGKDLEQAYTGDNGQMVGTADYQKFLRGGKA